MHLDNHDVKSHISYVNKLLSVYISIGNFADSCVSMVP